MGVPITSLASAVKSNEFMNCERCWSCARIAGPVVGFVNIGKFPPSHQTSGSSALPAAVPAQIPLCRCSGCVPP